MARTQKNKVRRRRRSRGARNPGTALWRALAGSGGAPASSSRPGADQGVSKVYSYILRRNTHYQMVYDPQSGPYMVGDPASSARSMGRVGQCGAWSPPAARVPAHSRAHMIPVSGQNGDENPVYPGESIRNAACRRNRRSACAGPPPPFSPRRGGPSGHRRPVAAVARHRRKEGPFGLRTGPSHVPRNRRAGQDGRGRGLGPPRTARPGHMTSPPPPSPPPGPREGPWGTSGRRPPSASGATAGGAQGGGGPGGGDPA